MKILDQSNNVVIEPDLDKGYLIDDVEEINHPAIKGRKRESHYEPKMWVIMSREGEKRKHYREDGEPKFDEGESIFGIEEDEIIDVEEIEPVPAWVESVEIKRYIEYTEDDLHAMQVQGWKDEISAMSYITTAINLGVADADQYAGEIERAKELFALINAE